MAIWPFSGKPKPMNDNAAARRLIQDRSAFWSGSFRTVTFCGEAGSLLGQFYLKAVRRSDRSWTVMRITAGSPAQQDDDKSDAVTGIKIVKAGLSFLDALDILAHFEASEAAIGNNLPAVPGEKEALGLEHYQAFGEREGLLFDQRGLPHETEGGEIVTEGEFRDSDQASFKKNFEPAQTALAKTFNGASNDDIVKLMSSTIDMDALDAVLIVLRKRDILNKIHDPLVNLTAYGAWRQGLRNGFDYRDFTQTCSHVILQKFGEIDKALAEEKAPDLLVRGVEVCRFAFYLQWAQQALHKRVNDHGKEDTVKTAIEGCRTSLHKLGMPVSDIARVESVILQGMQESPASIPEAVTSFIGFLKESDNAVRAEAAGLAQARTKVLPQPR